MKTLKLVSNHFTPWTKSAGRIRKRKTRRAFTSHTQFQYFKIGEGRMNKDIGGNDNVNGILSVFNLVNPLRMKYLPVFLFVGTDIRSVREKMLWAKFKSSVRLRLLSE